MAVARENEPLLAATRATHKEVPVDLRAEFASLSSMALQVSLSTFARLALMSVDFAFLGHLGTTELAAASLAAVWTSVPLMLVWGGCGALTTLCGQAWGARNGDLTGVWLQMGLLVVTALSVPVFVWYWCVEYVLPLSTDDPEVIRLGGRFARILSFSIWPSLVYVCVRLYFQSMGIMAATTVVGTLSIGVAIAANYFLIYGCFGWGGLGFDGSPLATVIASWFQPLALVGYCMGYQKTHLQAWGGWDWSAFTRERMATYTHLAVPIAINSLIATMASSGLSLIAAKLGSDVIAANAVVTGLWRLLWALFWGFGCATQIRVANCLGANRPRAAKALTKLGLGCTVVCVLLLAGLTLSLRERLFHLYTTDDALLQLCMLVQPIFVTGFVIESLELLAASILNAMGEAAVVAWASTLSTWLIELPLAYVSSVTLGFGFPALWYAICVMELVKLSVFIAKLSGTDWGRMARNAVENMEAAHETETELEEEALSAAMAEGGNAPLGANASALAPLTPIPTPSSIASAGRKPWGGDSSDAEEGLQLRRPRRSDSFGGCPQSSPLLRSELPAKARANAPLEPPVDLRAELAALSSMALQVSLSTFARLALTSVDYAFLGHLGTSELAAASLSTVWTSVPLMTIWSFGGALTTLCGQAWGARNGDLMGIWLQMGLVMTSVLIIPVFLWYWCVEYALALSTNDPEVIRLGVRFARIMSFACWPAVVYVCVRLYFQSMGIMAPTTIVGTLSIGVAIGANYVLIYGCFGWGGLGFEGSPLATVIASWFQPIALISYCIVYKKAHLQAWGGWDWSAFTRDRFKTYLAIAVPMATNSLVSNLASSALSLIAAKLGSDVIAANAVISGLWKLLWALFWGFGCATQIRVANCLGANRPKAALALTKLGLGCTVVCVLLLAGLTLSLQERLFHLYTTDDALLKLCMLVQPIFITGYVIQSVEILMASVLTAMGRAMIVAWTSTLSTWLIELPIAYLGGVTFGFGFPALWYSICIMEAVKLAVYLLAVSRTDWNLMARNAVENMEVADMTEVELEEEALSVALAEGGNTPVGFIIAPLSPMTPIPTPSSIASAGRKQWGDETDVEDGGNGLRIRRSRRTNSTSKA
ncbi:hypothetical protein PybrP1_004248 [[Pythium] brassicae (nom. inval.)]|nr:hypothetical protein PybrP1_004248 [[Pythium] brassicae (nom. inval.)]